MDEQSIRTSATCRRHCDVVNFHRALQLLLMPRVTPATSVPVTADDGRAQDVFKEAIENAGLANTGRNSIVVISFSHTTNA